MILYLLAIIVVFYLLYKFLHSKQKNIGKVIEKYENYAESCTERYKKYSQIGFSSKGRSFIRLETIKNWYIRLKEKFKYDNQKFVEIVNDYKNYTEALESYSVSQMGEESTTDDMENTKKQMIVLEEIENRFANLLGGDYLERLKNLRRENKF